LIQEELFKIAQQRSDTHKDHASQRVLSEDYNIVGISGEAAFAEDFSLEVDKSIKPSGDNGIDFLLPLYFTVDVKTAKKAYNLLLEEGKVLSDIYVLADYNEGDTFLVGWEWGKVLKQAPTKDFGYGVINHYIPAEELRPMRELYIKSLNYSH